MYQAMHALGFAADSPDRGPIDLSGAPRGASVLILGAGLAGMTAAYELRKAGYQVQVLEYNARAGGRNWSLRGGDNYTELGGASQRCEFDPGLYINPGPWRIPYHHYNLVSYCKRLGVTLEPFIQMNTNAYIHSTKAFGGKPQRYLHVKADYQGHVAELLAKSVNQQALNTAVSKEDQERLLESLRNWGGLDNNYAYVRAIASSEKRGYEKKPGGGLSAVPVPSQPMSLADVLDGRLWSGLLEGLEYDMQCTLFQPVGGMGRIGDAFARELGPLIRYRAKVTQIQQDDHGVTATYEDADDATQKHTRPCGLVSVHHPAVDPVADPHECRQADAGGDRCRAVRLVDQGGFAVQAPLLGRGRPDLRRHQLYRSADLQHRLSQYRLFQAGQGRIARRLHLWPQCDGVHRHDAARAGAEGGRVRQLRSIRSICKEFDNGVSVAWHRVPFTLGCFGLWSPETREQHYDNLCAIDGRIALAGEHASYLGGWQEGAITSALDAIQRLHQRVVSQGDRA